METELQPQENESGKKETSRNSVIFYRSFYESIKELSPENQSVLYSAIFQYSFDFKDTENLSGINKTIWILIKPQLDANRRKFINGNKPKKKQNGSKTEANNKQSRSKTEANDNVNVNDNVNNNNDNDNKNPSSSSFAKSELEIKNTNYAPAPPKFSEVVAYFKENGYTEAGAKEAFTYYSAKKWLDAGGNDIKASWQVNVQKWFKDKYKKVISNGGIVI